MPKPIFIIGSPRSGTSVLTWAIGQHPNISVQPETNWMPLIANAARKAYLLGSSRQEFTQLSAAEMSFEDFIAHFGNTIDAISRSCFQRTVDRLQPQVPQGNEPPDQRPGFLLLRHADEPKARWVDGTPEYSFSTFELSLLFPDSKFIHILRQPEQVVNSLAHFKNLGRGDTQSLGLRKAIRRWMSHTLASQEAAEFLGASRLLRVDYADLAANGTSLLERCFTFLDEPFSQCAADSLGTKLNSSKADDKQNETMARISNRSDFKKSQELYERLRSTDVPTEPSLEAIEAERARFRRRPHPFFRFASVAHRRFGVRR